MKYYSSLKLSLLFLSLFLFNLNVFSQNGDGTVSFQNGWSFFGYTCTEKQDAIDAFSPIKDKVFLVKDEFGFAYWPSFDFSNMDSLSYGEGYQIKMNEAVNNFQFCEAILFTNQDFQNLQNSVSSLQQENIQLQLNSGGSGGSLIGKFDFGGYIFHVSEDGSELLVAAERDLPGYYKHGCNNTDIGGNESNSGLQNNYDFFQFCNDTLSAFYSCDTLVSNGFDDWFLPSTYEMELMFNNIGKGSSLPDTFHLEATNYRTSNEINHNHGSYKNMNTWTEGSIPQTQKTSNLRVRPIRRVKIFESGCTDSNACNYNQEATLDDNSCLYSSVESECIVVPKIGDIFQGGIVFDISYDNSIVYIANLSDNYRVSNARQPLFCSEGANSLPNTEFLGRSLNMGYENTSDILTFNCSNGYDTLSSAYISDTMNTEGYGDWYIPSFDEIKQMFKNIGPSSNFGDKFSFNPDDNYWSSSLHSSTQAYFINSTNLTTSYATGTSDLRSRSIRKVVIAEFGCTNSNACNFNSNANQDDGSCEFAIDGDCPEEPNLSIGDYYEGGYIFHINDDGSEVLIADDMDNYYRWGCRNEYIESTKMYYDAGYGDWGLTDGNLLGQAFLQNCNNNYFYNAGDTMNIFFHADTLSKNGFTDWYVPSNYEMELLYKNSLINSNINLIPNNIYWTSNSSDKNYGYYLNTTSGTLSTTYKSSSYHYRPIRKHFVFIEGCSDSNACNYNSSVTQDDGSCLYNSENSQCASSYNIGDLYGGGIIYDISEDGSELKIAAQFDNNHSEWGCYNTNIGSSATSDDGSINSQQLLNDCNESNSVIYYSDTVSIGGYSDWYLPSSSEMNLLFLNLGGLHNAKFKNITSLTSSYYLTSNNVSNTHATLSYQNTSGVYTTNGAKNVKYNSRSVRKEKLFNPGCINSNACNYDPNADTDDGSCFYANTNGDCNDIPNIGENIQGGILFHIYENGEALIASPNDILNGIWGCQGYAIYAGDYGPINNENFIDNCTDDKFYDDNDTLSHFFTIDTMTEGGYDDWYLPSLNEMKIMNSHTSLLNLLEDVDYWTSSSWNQIDANHGTKYKFGSNSVGAQQKRYSYRSRPIRKINLYEYGCINSNACNYNTNATLDDGSCYYDSNGGNNCNYDVKVGDNFGGGIVFNVSDDKSYSLIVHPTITPYGRWGCYNLDILSLTNQGHSTQLDGNINSQNFLNECSDDGNSVFYAIDSVNSNGFDDWYLPSKNELEILLRNFSDDENMSLYDGYYFTSNEWDAAHASGVSFNTLTTLPAVNKNTNLYAKPIRKHIFFTLGCTDNLACNYDENANKDDESCFYASSDGNCPSDENVSYSYNGPQIGDFYEGGYVFQISNDGSEILISAQSDITGNSKWGCNSIEINGAENGNGFINTNDFFRNCDDTLSAFYSCDTFNSNGYNDWYLPSSLEMDSMYENIGAGSDYFTGNVDEFGINHDWYWTSSESNSSQALRIFMNNGSINSTSKTSVMRVRPIRKHYLYIAGCTDALACNFDSNADHDNGSCYYSSSTGDCPNTTLNIGDYYQGGIIFDINESSSEVLITLAYDYPGGPWANSDGCSNTEVNGAETTNGFINTNNILNDSNCNSESNTVFSLVDSLFVEGYDDWYIPSLEEVKLIYNNIGAGRYGSNLNTPSSFDDRPMWTSNEYSSTHAYYFHFGNSNFSSTYSHKYNNQSFRPIRKSILYVNGCIDDLACNYNSNATIDDGSCYYSDNLNNCSTELPEVGDYYEGGYIFDINENGDILIAAPTNVIGMKWGCYGTEIAGAESEYGNINARDFLRDCIETDNIFYYADTFEINGKNDWYVPSKDEMLKMNSLIVNGNVSGFENSVYLTSSEYNSTNFYRVNPFNISSSYTTKNTTSHFLRLMRKESNKYGCTDSNACNFNANANIDNGTCEYSHDQSSNSCSNLNPKIGDYFEGGYIVEISDDGSEYLIASNYDLNSPFDWGCNSYEITGAETESGFINTSDFINNCSETNNIFNYVDTSQINGYSDWYVPSNKEMQLIYELFKNDYTENSFDNWIYWTSNEYSSTRAYNFNMTTGSNSYSYKTSDLYVRPVRKTSSGLILGCMDSNACNYNLNATVDNNNCLYTQNLCQEEPQYSIGDFFEGGYIFEISENESEILIASPSDYYDNWGCTFDIIGSESDYGFINTQDVLRDCNDSTNIFYLTDTLVINGFDDWFVPSGEEMRTMHNNIGLSSPLDNIFGFENTNYWTSSEYDPSRAYIINNIGGMTHGYKSGDARFRPIRKYTVFTEGCTDSSACNYSSIATLDDGSCFTTENGNVDNCINNGINVGEFYQGGYVVKIENNGEVLIVAPYDISNTASWDYGCRSTEVPGSESSFGLINQNDVLNSGCFDEALSSIFKLTDTLIYNGYDDWYVPSNDEMQLVYELYKDNYSEYSFDNYSYWTSNEYGTSRAYYFNISSGANSYGYKTSQAHIRPVRKTFNTIVNGCTDANACNFNENATNDDNSCLFAGENQECSSGLQIGDVHEGGYIFYLDENGGGLVASQEIFENLYRYSKTECKVTDIPGAQSSQIFGGFNNSQDFLYFCNDDTMSAVFFTDTLISNGYDDWYVPSIEELEELINKLNLNDNLDPIYGFDNSFTYVSSTEYNSSHVRVVTGIGSSTWASKYSEYRVRPIRRFE